MRNITEKIKRWYEGTYIPPLENDPYSELFVVGSGHFEKHLLAKGIHHFWCFWKRTWHILFPLIITTIIALYIHHSSNSTRKAEQEKKNTQVDNHIEEPPFIELQDKAPIRTMRSKNEPIKI